MKERRREKIEKRRKKKRRGGEGEVRVEGARRNFDHPFRFDEESRTEEKRYECVKKRCELRLGHVHHSEDRYSSGTKRRRERPVEEKLADSFTAATSSSRVVVS